MYRERRIFSGAMLEIERHFCTKSGRCRRRENAGGTRASQERINLKNARKRLMRLMCCNFRPGDYHITLTFERVLPREERVKLIAKLLRKLRVLCRKRNGFDLKYICVREDRGQRPHFHLVCSCFALEMEELAVLWPWGRTNIGGLDKNPDYGWLARYLTKQCDIAEEKNKKRWSQSKNLDEPVEPPAKILKRKNLAARPQIPKDYYLMSAYRQATQQGYEWEYIVAIRYDRLQELPEEVIAELAESKTWREFTEDVV